MRYPLLCLALLFNLFACVAFAQDDAVAKNLDAAKDRYDKALREWYTSVSNWLDQREEAARKESNNKTAELIKLDRQAFLDKDETPESLPNPLKQDISDARKTLIAAYETAIKEYTKASKDTEATAVEKELAAFKAKIAVSNGDPSVASSTQPRRLTSPKWKSI
ncbi:hypothetical protein KIH39_17685 [Telmatocola sphagniphila]|uniref:Uncharacterized protein n=1 Tax=Telmatocola sphagniphila TaxID=1123043 RepID=A0A8E6B2T7_9BACT|nr:hypothetical protein [Telmatocola sphagniphila]QVL30676.1 hypothetical protein KIH39_17685 [Telmatocola sphagniphila]